MVSTVVNIFCSDLPSVLDCQKPLADAGLPDMRFHDVRRFGDCKIALKGQKVRAITF
jgi:hypothetical protein